MPRAGLTRDAVVALAVEIVDGEPLAPLTLAAVAARAGVAVPSLYKHIGNIDELRDAVAVAAVSALADAAESAIADAAGHDELRALARGIRRHAHAHPGLYAASQPSPGRTASPALHEAATRAVSLVTDVVGRRGVTPERCVDAVRILRAALHGFIELEARGGFGLPDSVDDSFERLLSTLDVGFAAL